MMAETPDNLSEYFASIRSKGVADFEVPGRAPCTLHDIDRMNSTHEERITRLGCFGDSSGKSAAVRLIAAFFKIEGQEQEEKEPPLFCRCSFLWWCL